MEASVEWLKGFLRRHLELSLRSREPSSMSCAVAFHKANVNFFAIFREQLNKHQYTADQIWNVDKTRFTVVHKLANILAKCGAKQV